MEILIALYLFVIGACFGSFAGAMAWRIEKGRDVVRDRSECEHCHHKLSAPDLIPVVSWLWLRGKCRYCRKPIGPTPLVLEVVLGAIFVVSYLAWPLPLLGLLGWMIFATWLVVLVLLTILFVYDLRHYILPDVVVWPLVGLGLVLFVMLAVQNQLTIETAVLEGLLSLLPISGVYWLLYVVSKGAWVGFGDVKLGIFMGLVLGWQGALLALVLANLLGTLVILPGLVSGRLKRATHVAFGPFLIAATVIVFLWGGEIIKWYVSFLTV